MHWAGYTGGLHRRMRQWAVHWAGWLYSCAGWRAGVQLRGLAGWLCVLAGWLCVRTGGLAVCTYWRAGGVYVPAGWLCVRTGGPACAARPG